MVRELSLVIILSLTIIACSSNDDDLVPEMTPPASSEITYTSIAVLDNTVNDSAAIDTGPEISSNGLELYFHSNRASSLGAFDLYVATRSTIFDPWGSATNLGATINSADDERAAALSQDGLLLYFVSDRALGEGAQDIYVTTRTTLSDPWSAPVNLGNIVNTANNESGPSVSSDGLSLYFQSDDGMGFGTTDLYVATRAETINPWINPTNLGAIINSPSFENAPEIATDDLSLYFHSDRTGGPGPINIWRATRTNASSAWGAPVALSAPVNSGVNTVGPGLSNDAQILYFGSDLGVSRDIWVAVP